MGEVMSLVGVHATDQDQDAMLADAHRQQVTDVPDRGWRPEPRQVGLGQHGGRSAERRDRRGPPRPEDDSGVVRTDAGALSDGVRCPPREFAGVGQGFGHSGRA